MPDSTLDLDLDHRRGAFRLTGTARLPLTGVTGISGPSGAGKTSLLRVIAGLDRHAGNTVNFAGTGWQSGRDFLAPHRRGTGLVFQDARLFPHLGVAGNLDYAARRARSGPAAPTRAEIIDLLGLAPLLDRRTHDLSGGERQRVALARALMARPRLLLLDEPLSALDAGTRQALLPALRERLSAWALPTLHVSHSADELAALADRVLTVREGRLGPVQPLDAWIATLGGETEPAAVITGRIAGHDARLCLTRLAVGPHALALPDMMALPVGAEVRLHILARDVALARGTGGDLSIRNRLPATLTRVTDQPGSAWCDVDLDIGGQTLRARITRAAAEALDLQPGEALEALVKSASLAPRPH